MKNILYKEFYIQNYTTLKHVIRMMKLQFVLLFMCCMGLYATNAHSQEMKVTIVTTNSTVREILQEIEEKTDYLFLYNREDVDVDRKTSVQATRKKVSDILSQIFANTDVVYIMEGSNIVLMKKNILQQITLRRITGRVLDEKGEPVIGANVMEKGTTNGTTTGIDGSFSLNISEGAMLQVSYIGYLTKEIPVDERNNMDITILEDTQRLDEVVVVGYGTSRKRDITGSIASVKSKELNAVASSSVSQMLQGKVTGMNTIQRSAQPGAGMSINIRGAVSPNGSNAPLYVIDGVPLQDNSTADPGLNTSGNLYDYRAGVDRDPLNTINPSDIESIEVLKDASAAAIYGASAANGVVLITTKSGKAGKVKVEYNSALTAQLPKAYPEVMNAREFREQANVWTREYYLYTQKMGAYGSNPVDLSGYIPVFADVNAYTADTDWMDEVTRNGYVIDQNLSANGGTEKTKYFFSYNYYRNVGMLRNSDMGRHNIRLNLDQEFSKRMKAGIRFSYSNLTVNSTSVGDAGNGDNMIQNALRFGPDIPVKDAEGMYSQSHNKLVNNPAAFLEITDKTNTERIFIAPTVELKLMDGLSLRGVGGYDKQDSKRDFFIPAKAQNTVVPDGMAQLGYSMVANISAETFFNYDKVFNDIHRISAVLGAGYYRTESDGFRLAGVGFFTDAFGTANVGIAASKDKEDISSWRTERTKLSQFARLNYSLNDKYMITLTGRRDGSSYFAKNNKWGFFPSASVAWRIAEEAFLKNNTLLSDLKLRIGYGTAGNENVIGTNAQASYKSGYNYVFGSITNIGFNLAQVENPNLKWETDYTTNIGIDYGFCNQRFFGSIEFFHRGVKDLLDYQTLPSNNAVGTVAANIGETQSKGFEFSLRSDNLTSKKLKWETTFNLSYFVANWVKRNPEVALPEYVGETDELDAIYGWQTDGIITSGDQLPAYMPDALPGNIKYVNQNDDNVLDSKDMVKLGNSTPRWMAGLGNTFSYRGFDLNFYFYGAFGYKKWRGQEPDLYAIGNSGVAAGNTYRTVITEVWNSQTGKGWMPGVAANTYDASNPTGNNNFYLMDGSYIKLKNITLGYTLPQGLFASSNFIQGARLFVDAQNVATFTAYKGFDPELQTGNPYPQAMSLSFGFNLIF
jgi:TonB-linked SusC/RagA family outer membrane protein